MALLVVLFVMVIVSFLCVSFGREMMLEMDSARYFSDDVQARLAAESAVARARIALADYHSDASDPGNAELLDNEKEFRRIPMLEDARRTSPRPAGSSEEGAGLYSEAYYYLLGARYDSDEHLTFGLIDEAAKLNVNVAGWEEIAKLPEMTDELAQAIVDFRDQDSEPLPYGAEDEYYQTLTTPYRAKNAPFESLDELLLVKGVTPAVLYGEDTNGNAVLDPWENDGDTSPPDDDRDGELDRGLAAYITVYSYDPNLSSEGEARVNLNTASIDEVRERLSQGMSAELVAGILARREANDERNATFSSMAALIPLVPALLQEENRESLAYLLDVATVDEAQTRPGLVNVNTAPLEVLRAVRGVTEEMAQAIDGFRREGGTDFSSPAWLLEVEAVGPERFLQVLPYVTTQSFQYRVEALGVGGRRNVFRRLEVVLDRARPDVPPIYWRDVTSRGEPLDLRIEAEDAG